MNKYQRVMEELDKKGTSEMKAFGNSMRPLIKSGSLLTFEKADEYNVGDVVFSRVKGRVIAAHKIIKKDKSGRYLIANNHGHENGWTRHIHGKVVKVNGEDF